MSFPYKPNLVFGFLSSPSNSEKFLSALTKSTYIKLWRDPSVGDEVDRTAWDKTENVLDHLDLSGSALAVPVVQRCARAVKAKLDKQSRGKDNYEARWKAIPKDPFASSSATDEADSAAPDRPARAMGRLASLVTVDDYPSAAQASEEQGTVKFKLGIGSNGRVTDCTITASSGSSSLDATTCRLLRARARFSPATDSSGNPTTDSVEDEVTWTLSR